MRSFFPRLVFGPGSSLRGICLVVVVLIATAPSLRAQQTVAVGATGSTQTATVTLTTAGTPGTIGVYTEGATGLDFNAVAGGTCSTSMGYTAGQTCTVRYSFAPRAPGQRLGAVQLISGSTVLGTALLSGTGTGPAATFPSSGVATNLAGISYIANDVAVDAAGNVYYTDNTGTVDKIIAVGGVVSSSSARISLGSGFNSPQSVAVDGAGNVFVADFTGYQSSAVYEIVAVGGVTSSASTVTKIAGFTDAYGVAVDSIGNLYVADLGHFYPNDGGLYQFAAVGGVVTSSSAVTELTGGARQVASVAVDSAGNVYFGDQSNHAVYELAAVAGKVSASSPLTTIGGFNAPDSIAVDGAGNVYVSDQSAALYEVVGAGSGNSTVLTLASPYANDGIAVDGFGNVFYSAYNVIGELPLATPPTINFPNTPNGYASPAQTLTFENAGNAPLSISSIASSSANFAFSGALVGGYSACGNTLASGAVCGLSTMFTPMANGLLSGTGVLTDNALNAASTQSVLLAGDAAKTSQTITFPQPATPAQTGSSATLTATSDSGLPVTYSITSGPATISGSTITYTGIGTVVIAADQAGNYYYSAAPTVSVSVTTTAPPFSYVPPAGAVGTAGSTQIAYVNITTAGTPGTISVLTQGTTGLDYRLVSGGTCSTSTAYSVGQFCTVMYTFTPRAPGQRPGAIQLSSGTTVLGTSMLLGSGTGPAAAISALQNSLSVTLGSGFNSPMRVAVDAAGDVYVADYGTGSVKEIIAVNGVTSSMSVVKVINSGFSRPYGVAVDGAGNVFVSDYTASTVKQIVAVAGVTSSTSIVKTIGSGFSSPTGIAIDTAGNVYVADYGSSSVKQIVATNGVVTSSSSVVTLGSGFKQPKGVAIDTSGNVYVADTGNFLVKQIVAVNGAPAPGSSVITVGTGFIQPLAVAVDGIGDVYVADSNNPMKEIVATGGVVSSSSATKVFSTYIYGSGLSVDGAGNVYIADSTNYAVREIPVTQLGALMTNTQVGTTLTQNFTLQNIGTSPLTISSVGLAASSNAAFTFVGAKVGNYAACGTTLVSDDICGLVETYTPTSSSTVTATANVVDNSMNVSSTQTLAFQGAGYFAQPTVTGTSPNTGTSTGGTTVTVTGTNFVGATAVAFGTIAATSFTVVNNTTITAVSPAETSNNYAYADVTVTTPYSTTATSNADRFLYKYSQAISFTQPATPAYVNQTATLAATGTSSGTPVAFSILSGPATLSGTNNATITYTGVGTVVIAANQAASTYYAAAPQVTSTVTVNVPSDSLSTAAVSATYGMASTNLTALLTYAGPSAPTGPVTFSLDGGSPIAATCTGTASPLTCSYSLSLSTLSTGSHTLATSYAGDSTYAAVSAPATTLTFSAQTPTLTVGTPATIAYGTANETLSASLAYTGTGAVPSGAVLFSVDGGTSVTAACTGTASPRTCTYSYNTAALSGGSHSITATYVADMNYTTATGSAMLTVTMDVTSLGLSVSEPNSGSVQLTAAVSGVPASYSSGTVTFYDSGTVVCSMVTLNNATAICATPTLSNGSHSFTAAYSGDSNFQSSNTNSAPEVVTVDPATNTGDGNTSPGASAPPVPLLLGFNSTFTLGAINLTNGGSGGSSAPAYTIVSGGTCTVGTTYSAGQNCTVDVVYTNTTPGLLIGTLSLVDNTAAANVVASATIAALGSR